MEISFKAKRIVVTGAGRGIGRDLCIALAKCGAQVVAISKTESNLNELKNVVPSIETVCIDLGDWNATREAMTQITKKPIHGLVNNAAVALLDSFLEVKEADFDSTFNINVKSVLNVSQMIAKEMVARKEGGAIVNISSQASKVGLREHALYCSSKGALDSLSQVMALELGKHNIRVNCVNPTVIMTDMGRIGWSDPVKANQMISKIPLGRFGEVHEVVNAVLFLLSDKASLINGVQLPLDGGFLATCN